MIPPPITVVGVTGVLTQPCGMAPSPVELQVRSGTICSGPWPGSDEEGGDLGLHTLECTHVSVQSPA
jgi:hypothetical protein